MHGLLARMRSLSACNSKVRASDGNFSPTAESGYSQPQTEPPVSLTLSYKLKMELLIRFKAAWQEAGITIQRIIIVTGGGSLIIIILALVVWLIQR